MSHIEQQEICRLREGLDFLRDLLAYPSDHKYLSGAIDALRDGRDIAHDPVWATSLVLSNPPDLPRR